jgi:Transposase, Mutator family
VLRDRIGSFEPVTVPVGQRRLSGLDQMVISLYAKGLTTGDITAHLFAVDCSGFRIEAWCTSRDHRWGSSSAGRDLLLESRELACPDRSIKIHSGDQVALHVGLSRDRAEQEVEQCRKADCSLIWLDLDGIESVSDLVECSA